MRLSSLSFTAVTLLLFSLFSVPTLLAQHGGGGGGGGSSGGGFSGGGSSGGGSHGGGGGSSGASSGGHSSGSYSSGSHSSGSHSSASHAGGSSGHANDTSSAPNGPRSNAQRIRDITHVALIDPIAAEPAKAAPGKRGFFSFLRHPFRKPESVAEFQRPVCWRGVCRVCPIAQVPAAGGCVTPHLFLHSNLCSHAEIWSGPCLQTNFLDDCSGLRAAMERQRQRFQAAAATRQNACSFGATQECTDLATQADSEANLYGVLQQKLNQCLARSRGRQANGNNPTPLHNFGDFGLDMYRP
jgi:hypothetical protein